MYGLDLTLWHYVAYIMSHWGCRLEWPATILEVIFQLFWWNHPLAPSSPRSGSVKMFPTKPTYWVPRNPNKSQWIPINSNKFQWIPGHPSESQEIPTKISIFLWSNSRPTGTKKRGRARSEPLCQRCGAEAVRRGGGGAKFAVFFLGKVGDMGLSENRVYSQL